MFSEVFFFFSCWRSVVRSHWLGAFMCPYGYGFQLCLLFHTRIEGVDPFADLIVSCSATALESPTAISGCCYRYSELRMAFFTWKTIEYEDVVYLDFIAVLSARRCLYYHRYCLNNWTTSHLKARERWIRVTKYLLFHLCCTYAKVFARKRLFVLPIRKKLGFCQQLGGGNNHRLGERLL